MSANTCSTSASPAPELPSGLMLLFATASGLSVANVYYAQPLLLLTFMGDALRDALDPRKQARSAAAKSAGGKP